MAMRLSTAIRYGKIIERLDRGHERKEIVDTLNLSSVHVVNDANRPAARRQVAALLKRLKGAGR